MTEISFRGANGHQFDISHLGLYSDNTPMVKTDEFSEIVENADTLVLRPSSLINFVTAMFLVDSIAAAGGKIEYLVLPYVPGARQDRSNPTGDVLFTIRSVASMINARSFSEVHVLDPHSVVTSILIHKCYEYDLSLVANKLWGGYTGIIAPDKGAEYRAGQMAEAMGKTVTYGSKVRDVATGKLSGFSIDGLEKGGHYLVVDDICDGGGTFIGLAEKIAEQGAYADLYVTHAIFSKGTRELRRHFKNIYTTDSLTNWCGQPQGRTDGVSVIRIVEDMVKGINDGV